MSVYALVDPEARPGRADLVVEVARAGDFAVTPSRRRPPACRWPSPPAPTRTAHRSDAIAVRRALRRGRAPTCTLELLPQVSEWLDDPGRLSRAVGRRGRPARGRPGLLASGRVAIDEVPELDLTVVDAAHRPPARPAATASAACGRTSSIRWRCTQPSTGSPCCWSQGDTVELRYRYESWVQYQSRTVRPRVDLTPLADELTALEPGPARWVFDGVERARPRPCTSRTAPEDRARPGRDPPAGRATPCAPRRRPSIPTSILGTLGGGTGARGVGRVGGRCGLGPRLGRRLVRLPRDAAGWADPPGSWASSNSAWIAR